MTKMAVPPQPRHSSASPQSPRQQAMCVGRYSRDVLYTLSVVQRLARKHKPMNISTSGHAPDKPCHLVLPFSFLLISGSNGNLCSSGPTEYSLFQIGSKALGVVHASSSFRSQSRTRCRLDQTTMSTSSTKRSKQRTKFTYVPDHP